MSPVKKAILFGVLSISMYVFAVFALSRVSLGTYPLIYSLCDGLNLKGGNSYQKFQEFDRNTHYDVVVMGSSHAYRGYDPRLFEREGLSAFNLGSSSQTPFNSYFLVEEYITQANCGLLLLDVFNVALEMDALESSADLIQNVSSNPAATRMAFSMKDPRALNMYALRMLAPNLGAYYKDTAYVGGGFSENRNVAPASTTFRSDTSWNMNEVQWTYLERIVALCEERDIPIVLVDHPSPQQTHTRRLVNSTKVITQFAEVRGIPFLDFSISPELDSRKYFYDHTHLNQQGVDDFNELLIEQLKVLGLVSSHASD